MARALSPLPGLLLVASATSCSASIEGDGRSGSSLDATAGDRATDAPAGQPDEAPGAVVDGEPPLHDPSDLIYDDTRIATFRLQISPADWDAICNDGAKTGDEWKRADMTWEGSTLNETVRGVAVKRSGVGTIGLKTPKPPIRISFSEFEFAETDGGVPDRKWSGVRRIKLDSMIGNTDPSMMRDRVAYQMFRKAGAPAPRVAHCRLFVNGDYKGLYIAEEPVRKEFLKYRWGENDGNLYQMLGWRTDAYDWYGPDVFARYIAPPVGAVGHYPFAAETNYPDGDYRDLVELIDIVNNVPPAQIRRRLEAHINLDGFLRHLALATVIGDGDDFSSFWADEVGGWCNNHFWYHRMTTDKLEVIKWDPGASQGLYDTQSMWPEKGYPPLAYRYGRVKMTAWVSNDPVAWTTYKAKIQQILDGPAAAVRADIDAIYRQIKQEVYGDPLKGRFTGSTPEASDPAGFTNAEFDAAVVYLRDWHAARAASLRRQLDNNVDAYWEPRDAGADGT